MEENFLIKLAVNAGSFLRRRKKVFICGTKESGKHLTNHAQCFKKDLFQMGISTAYPQLVYQLGGMPFYLKKDEESELQKVFTQEDTSDHL